MSLPQLYLVPQNQDDWRAWSFNHAAIHYTVLAVANRTKNQDLTQFQLDPIGNFGNFLYWHQIMHAQMNAVLGTSGFDLLGVDFTDEDQLREWLNLNAVEHGNWNTILGV